VGKIATLSLNTFKRRVYGGASPRSDFLFYQSRRPPPTLLLFQTLNLFWTRGSNWIIFFLLSWPSMNLTGLGNDVCWTSSVFITNIRDDVRSDEHTSSLYGVTLLRAKLGMHSYHTNYWLINSIRNLIQTWKHILFVHSLTTNFRYGNLRVHENFCLLLRLDLVVWFFKDDFQFCRLYSVQW
jgi:hypothetical protein